MEICFLSFSPSMESNSTKGRNDHSLAERLASPAAGAPKARRDPKATLWAVRCLRMLGLSWRWPSCLLSATYKAALCKLAQSCSSWGRASWKYDIRNGEIQCFGDARHVREVVVFEPGTVYCEDRAAWTYDGAAAGASMDHDGRAKAWAWKNDLVAAARQMLKKRAVKVVGLEVNDLWLAGLDRGLRIRVSAHRASERGRR